MHDRRLKFWADHTGLAVAPYAERADDKPNWFDRVLLEGYGRVVPWLPGARRKATRFHRLVDAWEREFDHLSDFGVRQRADQLRPRLLRQGFVDTLVAESFALVREVCRRRLGLWHHPVQIQGGYGLLHGALTEMATGEGKTITAALPAIAAALAGIPVHVVTVNDYLAQRDEEKLRPLFKSFGLTSAVIEHEMSPAERRRVYDSDIVYVTNKELAFDYLKDRIALHGIRSAARRSVAAYFGDDRRSGSPLILRGLHYAIVDEADSVLIDEARTPLIISADADTAGEAEMYRAALEIAESFTEDRHYRVNRKERLVRLTDLGKRQLEAFATDLDGLWRIRRAREELAQQALSALHLFEKDQQYIVEDGKVQIVDEFTGRIMEDRSWEGGLHQMIETKEGVDLTAKRDTLARITYQRFFRRYRRLSGMSGTVREISGEMKSVFDLRTVVVPTNRPVLRRNLGVSLYTTTRQKWAAVAERVKELAIGQCRPVLVGATSVESSEVLSALLTQAGVGHFVLNARQDKEEAAIVAQAGLLGRVTVATNMAGRGTDIALGPGVAERGGLHVILTEFHESSRIDRQLFGRAGRQGDPGSCESIVSLEDALFQRYAGSYVRRLRRIGALSPGGRLPSHFGRMLRIRSQQRAEKENLITRRMQVKQDKQLDKSLAFTGQSE